ncbi:hypothetical protein B0H12DRAFT_1162196 [Mycena haematopus]|nr:hypothetical protein B0H12DRAFT_1162196 [Mycena haematopus]
MSVVRRKESSFQVEKKREKAGKRERVHRMSLRSNPTNFWSREPSKRRDSTR